MYACPLHRQSAAWRAADVDKDNQYNAIPAWQTFTDPWDANCQKFAPQRSQASHGSLSDKNCWVKRAAASRVPLIVDCHAHINYITTRSLESDTIYIYIYISIQAV
jgi:hypothetical protein